jgi:hypothetical protein
MFTIHNYNWGSAWGYYICTPNCAHNPDINLLIGIAQSRYLQGLGNMGQRARRLDFKYFTYPNLKTLNSNIPKSKTIEYPNRFLTLPKYENAKSETIEYPNPKYEKDKPGTIKYPILKMLNLIDTQI